MRARRRTLFRRAALARRPALVRRLHGADAAQPAPSGACEQHAKFDDDTPCGLGILPDGRIVVLTMHRKRLLAYADGALSLYADLSALAKGTIDDMIIDGLGRAYVGDLGVDMPPPADRGAVGRILLVMPDGAARVVADGLRFPNGIAVSADHRRLVVAEMDGACLADYDIAPNGELKLRGRLGSMKSPDGICLDREGAVWVAAFEEDAFIRLDRSGGELQRIEVPGRRALACALGGTERKTLFCLSAATSYEELRQRNSSARIDVVDVEIAGAGYP
jgi:sugar lactone lactonase YvrE